MEFRKSRGAIGGADSDDFESHWIHLCQVAEEGQERISAPDIRVRISQRCHRVVVSLTTLSYGSEQLGKPFFWFFLCSISPFSCLRRHELGEPRPNEPVRFS